jgi:predicted DNA-binding protein YlxM (UPF0122 family)
MELSEKERLMLVRKKEEINELYKEIIEYVFSSLTLISEICLFFSEISSNFRVFTSPIRHLIKAKISILFAFTARFSILTFHELNTYIIENLDTKPEVVLLKRNINSRGF